MAPTRSKSIRCKLINLPVEILVQILGLCNTRELALLCKSPMSTHRTDTTDQNKVRVSRTLSELVRPVLWRSVDLSVHNAGGLFPARIPWIKVTGDNPTRDIDDIEGALLARQKRFAEAILRNSKLGELVRSLTWTYRPRCDDSGDTVEEGQLWCALRKLSRAEELDFGSMAESHIFPKRMPLPLFPSARQIRLTGPMPLEMATALLHPQRARSITDLDLDNLFDPGRPWSQTGGFCISRDWRSYSDGTPITRLPGPMRGHLRGLANSCTSLRRLSLRGVGIDYCDSLEAELGDVDEERYAKWADFINAVKPTLEELFLEQGVQSEAPDAGFYGCGTTRRRYAIQSVRPMDTRFVNHILPVLKDGPWPCLKALTVRGLFGPTMKAWTRFSRPTQPDNGFEELVEGLHGALGPDVKLIVERKPEKTYDWHGQQ